MLWDVVHKYNTENGRNMFRGILGIFENSVPNPKLKFIWPIFMYLISATEPQHVQ